MSRSLCLKVCGLALVGHHGGRVLDSRGSLLKRSSPVAYCGLPVFLDVVLLDSMMRSNLVRLMTGPSPECEESGDVKDGGDNLGDERRRKLVVDLDPPRFERFTGLLDVPGKLIGWVEAQNEEAAGARGGACAGRGREGERNKIFGMSVARR